MFQNIFFGFWKKKTEFFVLCEFYEGKSLDFSGIHFETPSITQKKFSICFIGYR